MTIVPVLLQNAFEEEVKVLTFYEISPFTTCHLQIRVTEGEAWVKTAGHWPVAVVRGEATQVLAELVIFFFFSKGKLFERKFSPDSLLILKAFSDEASGDSNHVVF